MNNIDPIRNALQHAEIKNFLGTENELPEWALGQDYIPLAGDSGEVSDLGDVPPLIDRVIDWSSHESSGASDAMHKQLREEGTEALAFYRSFRHGDGWGIFIRRSGIEYLSEILRQAGMDSTDCRQVSLNFLVTHELTHFRVDLIAASAEISTAKSFYVSGKRAWRARDLTPQYSPVEEAVCNAAARNSLPLMFRGALDLLMQESPIGYSEFGEHRGLSQESWNLVIGALVETTGTDVDRCRVNPVAFTVVPNLTKKLKQVVPIYLVDDTGTGFKGFTASFVISTKGVIETDALFKAIRKTGDEARLLREWESTRANLNQGIYTNGMKLQRLKGSKDRWSVRLSLGARAGLIETEGEVFAVFAALKGQEFESSFLKKNYSPDSLMAIASRDAGRPIP
jgi:hypothetical protein